MPIMLFMIVTESQYCTSVVYSIHIWLHLFPYVIIMEEARKNFETMVGLAERKLDDIEKKIDDKFDQHLKSDEDVIKSDATLVETLNEVKAEYQALCQEAASLNQAQKQMAQAFQQELLAQVKQLQMLQDKGVFAPPENDVQSSIDTTISGYESNLSHSANESNSK